MSLCFSHSLLGFNLFQAISTSCEILAPYIQKNGDPSPKYLEITYMRVNSHSRKMATRFSVFMYFPYRKWGFRPAFAMFLGGSWVGHLQPVEIPHHFQP